MKDKLLYLTIGLLIGIVVMQWGVSSRTVLVPSARAGLVYPGNDIAAFEDGTVLDRLGQVWRASNDQCWVRDALFDPPVPVSDIREWGYGQFVTNSWELWTVDSSGQWHNCGPWPGQPVPTEQNSWGDIKTKLNKDGD
jgi:hypothetical protein